MTKILIISYYTIISDSTDDIDSLSVLLLLLCEQSCGLTVLLRSIIIVVAGSSSTTTTTTERDDWARKDKWWTNCLPSLVLLYCTFHFGCITTALLRISALAFSSMHMLCWGTLLLMMTTKYLFIIITIIRIGDSQ